jgi:hypothetical protein
MKRLLKFNNFNKISESNQDSENIYKWCGEEFTATKKLEHFYCSKCKSEYDKYITSVEGNPFSWTETPMKKVIESSQSDEQKNEEISFKKMATAAALAGAVAFGSPAHSQDVKKDSIEQVSKVKGEITSIKELKKMGYKIDDSIDDSQKNLKLELTNIKGIGSVYFAAQRQFRANLDANGVLNFQLNRGNSGFGFSITRELDNGTIEFRLVKILK